MSAYIINSFCLVILVFFHFMLLFKFIFLFNCSASAFKCLTFITFNLILLFSPGFPIIIFWGFGLWIMMIALFYYVSHKYGEVDLRVIAACYGRYSYDLTALSLFCHSLQFSTFMSYIRLINEKQLPKVLQESQSFLKTIWLFYHLFPLLDTHS